MDARPEALEAASEIGARPKVRAELMTWVEQAFVEPRLVIKDPRAFWFRDLWVDAAESAGARLSFVTMLRHPAESVDSRLTHYMKDEEPAQRAAQGTTHLAGWINDTLVNERTSRSHRRAFVQYTDLIQDWRSTMNALRDALGLGYDADLSQDEHHPIDDFIDPALHRVKATWEDLVLPEWLRDQGEDVWQALVDGSDLRVENPDVLARLDTLQARYAAAHAESVAVAADSIEAAVRVARRETRKTVAAEHRKAQQEEAARRREAEERERQRAASATPAVVPTPSAATRRPRASDVVSRGRRLGGRVLRRGRKVAAAAKSRLP